ncbi:putative 3-oxoacyl-[acyl-carrier-protein] reductase [Helianthus anomalus]
MAVSSQQVATFEQEPWRDLKGKIVMVTAASSGLGWEFCIDLAKFDCRIIAAARRTDRLKALCHEINNHGQMNIREARNHYVLAVLVELDVNVGGPAIEASVKKAWEAFGRIDALINNAGITGVAQNSLDLSEEDWDKTFRTNLKGAWLVSKYVGLQMRAFNQAGSIINISSITGHQRTYSHGSLAYASSKSALNTMTKKWLKQVMSKLVPLGDFGTVDPALTSLVRYLICDTSDYVTCNSFIVDGGFTLASVSIYSSL